MRKPAVIFLLLLLPAAVFAGPNTPEINAASAILIEAGTETVLFEKNADEPIPPASMTKLMTIHLALGFVDRGTASLDSLIPISRDADFRNLPPRSSLMFLEEGQRVSLLELLKGLALPSGNDAGIAVAEYLAGGVADWVALMNSEADRLGMSSTRFDDASGLSEHNITTARDFASFCAFYIEEHAYAVRELHLLTEFTYPEKHNLPEGRGSVHGPITQPNHNLLIGRMNGVDGLKTGYIDESGYNLAATAELGGRRFILVTMGGRGTGSWDGGLRRVIDAVTLFNYGRYGWMTVTPAAPSDRRMRIWGGAENYLSLDFSPAEPLTLPSEKAQTLGYVTELGDPPFPISAGDEIGSWLLMDRDGVIYQRGRVLAGEDMAEGNIFKRLSDKIRRAE